MDPRPDAHARSVSLPLVSNRIPGRQGYTCQYRCGNACAHEAPNPTRNQYFGDVLASVLDRRGVLRAGATLTLVAGAAHALGGTAIAAPGRPAQAGSGRPVAGLDYEPVASNSADEIRVPPGYNHNVVIRWGDPVLPDAPEYDFDNQSAEAQALQFGYNCDFCGLVPLEPRGGNERFIMISNHEYTIEPLMFRDYDEENPTDEQIRIGLASHGASLVVVESDRRTREMTYQVDPQHNRRLTAASEFVFDGPAAGSDFLRTSADPEGTTVLGTLNNCAGGVTPWGTFLTAEENFNQYFANADQLPDATARERAERYGIPEGSSGRKWERLEPRFDLADEPNEVNRFGWIVEVDPYDNTSVPVKHTALGRFKHEGATIALTKDGRAVAYLGDDEKFDYVYKFVSDEPMMRGRSRRAREHNLKLLSSGTLYVARFTGNSPESEIDGSGELPSDGMFDGSGEWIPIARGSESLVPGMTADEVYVFTRQAGDAVGATKMDRPEDVEPNPATGNLYIALTNNTDRGAEGEADADEPNPRDENKHGHVIELVENGQDAAAVGFSWNILIVCGDPDDPSTYFGGFDKSEVSPITSPDNLAFDGYGNLFISTDSTRALDNNDGLYGVALEGDQRGKLTLFASVPLGSEACGPIVTDRFVMISPQHPGDTDDASIEDPASNWPDGGDSQPRPSVVNIFRDGGGRIGR